MFEQIGARRQNPGPARFYLTTGIMQQRQIEKYEQVDLFDNRKKSNHKD
jgi:hypothetical protein